MFCEGRLRPHNARSYADTVATMAVEVCSEYQTGFDVLSLTGRELAFFYRALIPRFEARQKAADDARFRRESKR